MSVLFRLATQAEAQAGMADSESWLQPSERARLSTLRAPARREAFIAGRWLARQTVREWLGAARLPRLDVADSGACLVVGEGEVFASISHSGGHVACAVGSVPVGVDVEATGRERDYLALASAVHGQPQQDEIVQAPASERARVFLRYWCLKEAWFKARGQGLDFAEMRALTFEPQDRGDAAVATAGALTLALAVAACAEMPDGIEGAGGLAWQRYRSRRQSEPVPASMPMGPSLTQ